MILPALNEQGVLPSGLDVVMTFPEVRESYLVHGGVLWCHPHWNASQRLLLLDNFEKLVRCLWRVGVQEVYLGGSFVENKPHPNDIDGYFVCPDVRALRSGHLSEQLDGVSDDNMRQRRIWHWKERVADPETGEMRLAMWYEYHVELIPTAPTMKNAIVDSGTGERLSIPQAFRLTSNNLPKGIIRIRPEKKAKKTPFI